MSPSGLFGSNPPVAGAEATEVVFWIDEQMEEIRLLLPADQLAKLERVADQDGRTVAQVLRRLIQDSLRGRQVPGQGRSHPGRG